eukprot:MONOS_14891.1-p1 / transcript=MONOS_14891.1 / gene=MONOS_14891 / organism=Monocercomonoides_exilis_PA203 / gene_product=unspecified product / transcript_product=unspecified product / location=Mono_scaffold01099:632-1013(-) / protein_length=107 / sequence_SO=supercontig / SO=protein_coding / is_pseudo=false
MCIMLCRMADCAVVIEFFSSSSKLNPFKSQKIEEMQQNMIEKPISIGQIEEKRRRGRGEEEEEGEGEEYKQNKEDISVYHQNYERVKGTLLLQGFAIINLNQMIKQQ